ncbi:MAG: hypothetical protein CVU11_11310 [Bacteroidetes bacterium HGW-Bacteroidetes-6]|jgi:hypothetical protein|nr:MAG: hypothetical protein CVU11_11310 [Bacteroidetes bacterium HGW-Bacteroidetes-6]
MLFLDGTVFLALGILAFAVLSGLFKFRKISTQYRWFFYFLVLNLSLEITAHLLLAMGRENIFLYPLNAFGEFFILGGVFINGLKWPRFLFIIAGIIATLLFIEPFIFWKNGQTPTQGIGIILSHLTIITLSGYYLLKTLMVFEKKEKNSFLLICSFLFLYYAVSLFSFLLLEQFDEESLLNAYIVWSINNILSALLYGSALISFLRAR